MTATRKFHSIAALCGDGLRPELQALFERLAIDPRSELFVRKDGMAQSGPDPVCAAAPCSQLFLVAPGAQQENPAPAPARGRATRRVDPLTDQPASKS
jgi:hypothetical protein